MEGKTMIKRLLHLLVFIPAALLLAGCTRYRVQPFIAPTGAPVISAAAPQADPPTETQAALPTAEPIVPSTEPAVESAPTQPPLEVTIPELDPTLVPVYLPVTSSQTVDVWVAPYLPSVLRSGAGFAPFVHLSPVPSQTGTDLILSLDVGSQAVISRWVYALATPFPGSAQRGLRTITFLDVLAHWQGYGTGLFTGQPLLMTQETLDLFTRVLGSPNPASVRVVAPDRLLADAWTAQAGLSYQPVLALIPFEAIEPHWSVLPVDGQSPLDNHFDPAAYALSVPFSISGDAGQVALALDESSPDAVMPFVMRSNRDANRLTVVVLTGVTALVRATASTMERQGITYPALDVGPILRAADITHISNEVPFAVDCPEPNPNDPALRFCSQDEYIELMEVVGTDVVELTGDHFHDWGAAATLHTVEMYNARGWPYYGGGVNLADGQRPAIIEHNGNRIAFLGCNGKGIRFGQATDTNPGSAACDMPKMAAEVTRLAAAGYLVIFTFQHHEYYDYSFPIEQADDFQLVADAGAVVVSGSQAHQPHEMEFRGAGFIHYGLGNLFFDQFALTEATRQGIIDRHVFYNGRYLGVELIPIYFVDYARPRLMTNIEATDLLRVLYRTSGLMR